MAALTQQLRRICSTRAGHLRFANNIHAGAPRPCKMHLEPSVSHPSVLRRPRRSLSVCSQQADAISSSKGIVIASIPEDTYNSSQPSETTSNCNKLVASTSKVTPGKLLVWSLPLPAAAWMGWRIYQQFAIPLVTAPLKQVLANAATGATVLTGMLMVATSIAQYIDDGALWNPDDFCHPGVPGVLVPVAAVGGLFGAIRTASEVVPLLLVGALATCAAIGCYALLMMLEGMLIRLLAAAMKGVRETCGGMGFRQPSQSVTAANNQPEDTAQCDYIMSELKEFDKLLATSGQQ